jgi:hypothetical protein
MAISLVKKIMFGIMLFGLLLAAACATGTISSSPTSPSSPQEQDPMYWQMLQDLRGVSG